MDKILSNSILKALRICIIVYGFLCLIQWVNYISYIFYTKYIYIASLHNLFMGIGTSLFFTIFLVLLLKITRIIKIGWKLSLVMFLLLLSNLLLIYLEIRKQGDSWNKSSYKIVAVFVSFKKGGTTSLQ